MFKKFFPHHKFLVLFTLLCINYTLVVKGVGPFDSFPEDYKLFIKHCSELDYDNLGEDRKEFLHKISVIEDFKVSLGCFLEGDSQLLEEDKVILEFLSNIIEEKFENFLENKVKLKIFGPTHEKTKNFGKIIDKELGKILKEKSLFFQLKQKTTNARINSFIEYADDSGVGDTTDRSLLPLKPGVSSAVVGGGIARQFATNSVFGTAKLGIDGFRLIAGTGLTAGILVIAAATIPSGIAAQHFIIKNQYQKSIKHKRVNDLKEDYRFFFDSLQYLKCIIFYKDFDSNETFFVTFNFDDNDDNVKNNLNEYLKIMNLIYKCLQYNQETIFNKKKKIWENVFDDAIRKFLRSYIECTDNLYKGRRRKEVPCKEIGSNNIIGCNIDLMKKLLKTYEKDINNKLTIIDLLQETHRCHELRHLTVGFLESILKSASQCRKFDKPVAPTGYYLDNDEFNLLKCCAEFCDYIYTDDHVKSFLLKEDVSRANVFWNNIIEKKNIFDEYYKTFKTIEEEERENLRHSNLRHVDFGRDDPNIDIAARPEEIDELKQLTNRKLLEIADKLNDFLKSDWCKKYNLERYCFDYESNEAFNSYFLHKKFQDVSNKISSIYKWHINTIDESESSKGFWGMLSGLFSGKQPCFKSYNYNDKNHKISARSLLSRYFMHKLPALQANGIQIDKDNISVIHVGFRNKKKFKDTNKLKKEFFKVLKGNPDAYFDGTGELDYIAFIEKVNEHKHKLFIMYSGSNSARDWCQNTKISVSDLCGLSGHKGIFQLSKLSFSTYQSTLLGQIAEYYKDNEKPTHLEVVCAGHSLGGALALLAAYKLKEDTNFFNKIFDKKTSVFFKVLTFGAPAILCKFSKQKVEKKLGKENIYSVYIREDLVPGFTKWIGYDHVGIRLPLDNILDRSYGIMPDFWSPHLIGRYISYIKDLECTMNDDGHRVVEKLSEILKREPFQEYINKARMADIVCNE